MNTYLLIKTVHILSSVLMVGTGFGTAFYLFFANRSGSVESIATVSRLVVRADAWFTAPAALIQPLTGFWLLQQAGWPITTPWVLAAIGLYLLAGACWLPVLWLQIRMAKMAAEAVISKTDLPDRYWRYARLWERLGYPAFVAMLVIYFLMVVKPSL
ncbi:MAG: DUF2269 domain-containing protein [Betaproteobacteria bacterium]|nr:DUF2269 domain-containing protein [Betaproteobacteria bacterium]